MKFRKLFMIVTILSMLLLQPGPSAAQTVPPDSQPSDAVAFKPGELLIRFDESKITAAATQHLAVRYQATPLRTLNDNKVQLWQVSEGKELAIAKALSADPSVLYAEPNYIYHAFLTPNDPSYGNQWAHPKINSPGAWDLTTGSTSITIAIIDTGIDESHPDLTGKIVTGYDYVGNDSNPHDENGHGTHVAGIAAATGNNGTGVAGLAWGARIMPVRVLDNEGSGYTDDIVEGIRWAYQHGAKIINMSLGGTSYSSSMQAVINEAHNAGTLVVAAMGNNRTSNPTNYPAANTNVMAVAATGPSDIYAYYSQYGNHCDIAAPGGSMGGLHDSGGIYSSMPTYAVYMTTEEGFNKNYDYAQGTSMAAPYVAGLAALVWSQASSLTPDQVQAAIQDTAVDLGTTGWDSNYGYGRINARAAVASVSGPAAPNLLAISNADGDGSYLVDWDSVSTAVSYRLQEDDNATFSSPTVRYTGSATQYQITGQSAGTWYYRVVSNNGTQDGQWSTSRSVNVYPTAPVLHTITNLSQSDTYTLNWSTVSDATDYTLEEASSAAFSDATIRYLGSASTYSVTGQQSGTWYYRVQAAYLELDSNWSNVYSTTIAAHSLSEPELNAISNEDEDGAYTVSWSAVSGASSYILEENLGPYFEAPVVAYTGSATQRIVANHNGGTWSYRVRATNASGQSAWSNQQSTLILNNVFMPLIAKNYGTPSAEPLLNGDFESGATNWTEYSSNGWPIILYKDDLIATPHGGNWAAWLGGDNNEDAYIQQQVTVPSAMPYLAYWYWIGSEDVCGYDYGGVRVNSIAVDSLNLCSSTSTGGWVKHTVNLSGYAGQSVALKIWVDTDGSFNSNLFVDDVAFQSSASLESVYDTPKAETDDLPSMSRR